MRIPSRSQSQTKLLLAALVVSAALASCYPRAQVTTDQPSLPLAAGKTGAIVVNAGEFPPFMFSGGTRGVFVEITKEAFRRMGKEVSFTDYPMIRGIRMTAEGEIDGQLAVSRDTLWAASLMMTMDIMNVPISVFTTGPGISPNKSWFIELADRNGGTLAGSSDEAILSMYGISYESSPNAIDLIKKLLAGRIDFILEERDVIEFELWDKMAPTEAIKVRRIDPPAFYESLAVAFSLKKPGVENLKKDFDSAFMAMLADGSVKAILDKYAILP